MYKDKLKKKSSTIFPRYALSLKDILSNSYSSSRRDGTTKVVGKYSHTGSQENVLYISNLTIEKKNYLLQARRILLHMRLLGLSTSM